MAASARVQQILAEVRELSEEEQAELEAELCAENANAGRAWGEEVDRRAARVIAGGERGLDRDEVRALFALPPPKPEPGSPPSSTLASDRGRSGSCFRAARGARLL